MRRKEYQVSNSVFAYSVEYIRIRKSLKDPADRYAPVPVNWVSVGLIPIDSLNRVYSF